MWKQNKVLIIVVSLCIVVMILLFVFKDKMFKKKQSPGHIDGNNNDYGNIDTNINASGSFGMTKEMNDAPLLKVGDKVVSNAQQSIVRVKIENGKYVNLDSGRIAKNATIGTVEKLTPSGYYVKANPNLSAKYYWVGRTQVK